MTHTKGPWKVTQNDRGRSIVNDEGKVVSLFQSSLIGDMHLMAAAPDLLEALEEIVELMDAVNDGQYAIDSFTTQPAKEAIQKARES